MKTFLLLAFIINSSYATHFRYGTFFWQPVSNSTNSVTMLITHSWGWRLSYPTNECFCDNSVISSGTLMGIDDNIICDVGCFSANQVVGDTRMYCTAFSSIDDWSLGYKSYNVTFPSNVLAEIYFYGTNW